MTYEWGHDAYCDRLEAEAVRFADVVRDADPKTPVPTCPDWTIADLVKHHGTSQRRVETVVRTLAQQPVWSKDLRTGLPDSPDDYPTWFAAGVAPLLATLRAADPAAPMWTNGVDQRAGYWARRILFEAVVHGADADIALDRAPDIDAATGADGIDEFLTNVPSFAWVANGVAELPHRGQSLVLRATDLPDAWTVTLAPAGYEYRRAADPVPAPAVADVTVAGSSGELLLLVYGRLAPDEGRFAVTGDRPLLNAWLKASAL